jgi:hypothetical protein
LVIRYALKWFEHVLLFYREITLTDRSFVTKYNNFANCILKNIFYCIFLDKWTEKTSFSRLCKEQRSAQRCSFTFLSCICTLCTLYLYNLSLRKLCFEVFHFDCFLSKLKKKCIHWKTVDMDVNVNERKVHKVHKYLKFIFWNRHSCLFFTILLLSHLEYISQSWNHFDRSEIKK